MNAFAQLDSTPASPLDVLIVGAGPTGLILAADLARCGVTFRIIDVARGATDLSKAIGVQARTLEMLDSMGLAGEFVAHGQRGHSMSIHHDKAIIAHFSLAELDSPFPYILMLPQSETERLLLAQVETSGIRVEREVKLTTFTQDEAGVTATLLHPDGREESVRAGWIVGCDGAHSTVRHTLNLPFEGEAYEEGFQLADVKLDWEFPPEEIHLFLHESYLLAAFALPGGRYRLIYDVPPEQAPVGVTPSLEELQQRLNERCPFAATISDPLWMANYRIHRRIVSKLREGRAFLVGDAAHIHSPALAQGMNTGIQDALNLGWKLALVAHGEAPTVLLDSYHAERYPVEQSVLRNTDLPLRAVGLKNPVAVALRDKLMQFVTGLDRVQEGARRLVSEIGVGYYHSPIVEEHALPGGPRAGERASDGLLFSATEPQTVAESEMGSAKRLFELLRGSHHKVLVFMGSEMMREYSFMAFLFLASRSFWGESIQLHAIRPNTVRAPHRSELAWKTWNDPNSVLHQHYGAEQGGVYLVRPDGYIGFRSPLIDDISSRFGDYLSRHYTSTH